MRTRTKRSLINNSYSRKKIGSKRQFQLLTPKRLRILVKPQLWLRKKPISRTTQLKSSRALWVYLSSKNKRKCKRCSKKINSFRLRNVICHDLRWYQNKIWPSYQNLSKENISARSGHMKRVLSKGISLLERLPVWGSTNSSASKKNYDLWTWHEPMTALFSRKSKSLKLWMTTIWRKTPSFTWFKGWVMTEASISNQVFKASTQIT